jgi:hypothetical protein
MKGQWGRIILAVMMALLLGGCASSISEIRQNEPHLTLSSTKPPQEVAKCIDLRARAETGGSMWKVNPTVAFEERPDQTYHIVLTVPPYGGLADILVMPSGSGSSVEYRRGHWWNGEKQFLEIVEQCAR